MKATLVLLSLATLSIAGCSHGVMRGSVAMKVSDSEAHVCMNSNEVKKGDRVALFRNVCAGRGSPKTGGDSSCRKERVGQGFVKEIINEHYSDVQFDPGVAFAEGMFVEKL